MNVPGYLPYLAFAQVTIGSFLFLAAACRIFWAFVGQTKCLKKPIGLAPSFVVYLTCIFLECLTGSAYYGYLAIRWKYGLFSFQ